MRTILIRKGDDAFDGLEVLAEPLATRESRVFRRVTYASHSIKLARLGHDGLAILMENGSGRSVWSLPDFYDDGAMAAAWLALPEAVLYATLYTVWSTASEAAHFAEKVTANAYADAYAEKRLKIQRRGGRRYVRIEPRPPLHYTATAGAPPLPVPGTFATTEAAFAAAREAHPTAGQWGAVPHYAPEPLTP